MLEFTDSSIRYLHAGTVWVIALLAPLLVGCQGESQSELDKVKPSHEPIREVEQRSSGGGSTGSTGEGEFELIVDFAPLSDPDIASATIEVAQVVVEMSDASGTSQVPLLTAPEIVTLESTTEPHRYIVGPLHIPAGMVHNSKWILNQVNWLPPTEAYTR